jgi:hypothetical protein
MALCEQAKIIVKHVICPVPGRWIGDSFGLGFFQDKEGQTAQQKQEIKNAFEIHSKIETHLSQLPAHLSSQTKARVAN